MKSNQTNPEGGTLGRITDPISLKNYSYKKATAL